MGASGQDITPCRLIDGYMGRIRERTFPKVQGFGRTAPNAERVSRAPPWDPTAASATPCLQRPPDYSVAVISFGRNEESMIEKCGKRDQEQTQAISRIMKTVLQKLPFHADHISSLIQPSTLSHLQEQAGAGVTFALMIRSSRLEPRTSIRESFFDVYMKASPGPQYRAGRGEHRRMSP
ncbi:hypothetical protein E4U53_006934 [Claviceps sorghi]|nr:hypothetical protein E4U53_006934 [Claviceps sorghi]